MNVDFYLISDPTKVIALCMMIMCTTVKCSKQLITKIFKIELEILKHDPCLSVGNHSLLHLQQLYY